MHATQRKRLSVVGEIYLDGTKVDAGGGKLLGVIEPREKTALVALRLSLNQKNSSDIGLVEFHANILNAGTATTNCPPQEFIAAFAATISSAMFQGRMTR